ncbi:hypothetical protein BJ741DRAFT_581170 [Chytriomyces cf. hyalinus JEL632]|nr:hypothetical protein BJ741DRAFT_581170 [Chytriomyces cf. hyalinus JEL632]
MATTVEKLFPGFTAEQKRNLLFYTIGIMCYKLGLESALGAVKTMMTERFNSNPATSANAFCRSTLLKEGKGTAPAHVNVKLMQSLGSIAVAPLIFRFKTPHVLSAAITFFAALSVVFLILEPATGGQIVSYIVKNGKDVPDPSTYGNWSPYLLFPLFLLIGGAYGIIELIRRVIPRDIVGGDVAKLKKMDATVHIWYEVAGTGGAFFSAFMIQKLGHVYAISPERNLSKLADAPKRSFLASIGHYTVVYFSSIVTGARIIFSSRRFLWLIPGYSLGLVYHRYLENGVAPNFSKIVFDHGWRIQLW